MNCPNCGSAWYAVHGEWLTTDVDKLPIKPAGRTNAQLRAIRSATHSRPITCSQCGYIRTQFNRITDFGRHQEIID